MSFVRPLPSPRRSPTLMAASLVALLAACTDFSSPPPPTFTQHAGEGEVFVGAGDIADCTLDAGEATAAILDTLPGTVYTTGDNAYPSGTAEDFTNCYEPTWGRHRDRTRPVPGNHEYETDRGAPYFDYFGAAAGTSGQGYYSYDLGSWHVIALNSEIPTWPGSPQHVWLENDLAAMTAECTIAYWHRPRFTSGMIGNSVRMGSFWQLLYNAGVEIVLSGHAHNYERFAPQAPDATADPITGIRQFVVGTGGAELGDLRFTPAANTEVLDNTTFGVLMFTLRDGSYHWDFIPVGGGTFTDSGDDVCHDAPSGNQPPVASAGADQIVTDTDGDGSESVNLDGSGSTDEDGTIGSWRWLEDGAAIATGETATVTLAVGVHTITLEVTDDAGDTATDDVVIDVDPQGGNQAPTPSFSFTCNGLVCDFTDESSDGDGSVVAWSWDFGDGASSTTQHPSHTFTDAGTYTVTLTATDDNDATASQSQDVTVLVANQAPTASFTFTCTDLTCDFTDQSSDADGSVTAWSWSFGDGTESTQQHPSHTFAAAGTSTVTLTVTDDMGDTGQVSQDVIVVEAGSINLTSEIASWGGTTRVILRWTGSSATMDVYRNSTLLRTAWGTAFVDQSPGTGTIVYQVCERGTSVCSNEVTVEL